MMKTEKLIKAATEKELIEVSTHTQSRILRQILVKVARHFRVGKLKLARSIMLNADMTIRSS